MLSKALHSIEIKYLCDSISKNNISLTLQCVVAFDIIQEIRKNISLIDKTISF